MSKCHIVGNHMSRLISFFLTDMLQGGHPYGDIYEPTVFGSAGGGKGGGRGGGRIWLNATDTVYIDGKVTANGGDGVTAESVASGGASGGSIWIHCYRITGYGLLQAGGGKGAASGASSGGGGAGGRIALYFSVNRTFSEFRYLAGGGWPGRECAECEAGGPGTVFIYHNIHAHRTLIIDNNGAPNPREKYVNWEDTYLDGGRAWILPESGLHDFATGNEGSYMYQFEELQIYGNGHLAVKPPTIANKADENKKKDVPDQTIDVTQYSVIIFFKYMIGDRTGSVHIAAGQSMDLLAENIREESDLPFNAYISYGGLIGLAPITFVHGVEIHLNGIMAHVRNITLRHNGYLWLKEGGRTLGEKESEYRLDYMRIQDKSGVNATADPIEGAEIKFYMKALTIEGGATMHGTYMSFMLANITVDDGGVLSATGLGYNSGHSASTHGRISVHGEVNPGIATTERGGGGHGGSGGRYHSADNSFLAGLPYGDIYRPNEMGSSGGLGTDGRPGGTGGGRLWFNITDTIDIDGVVSADGVSGIGMNSGGGSGGSIWMYCNIIKGYGTITANGGYGIDRYGCGGAGGRIAVYFQTNRTMSSFRYHAYGGDSGSDQLAESGGSGTVFIYNTLKAHKTLIVDNGGRAPVDKYKIITDYHDITYDSCRTWIVPVSAYNEVKGNTFSFWFNELQIYGAAHFAIKPEHENTNVELYFLYMIGDRTGTVHIGDKQVMDLNRPEIDTPFNIRVYSGGYLGLAPFTIVQGVTIWLHGEMANIDNITLHHGGLLFLYYNSFTHGQPKNTFNFLGIRIQDNATINLITDPVTEGMMTINVQNAVLMEGGGTLVGTHLNITATNVTIDNGANLHGDSLGYRNTDSITSLLNLGKGKEHSSGSSGAGHGGTSGRGQGSLLTGQPYGDLFEPHQFGSSGGSSEGGQGGGIIHLNVFNRLQIDGEIRVNGGDSFGSIGGGGSGGSLYIKCYVFKGTGNITANGGSTYSGWKGGGGAGGRIAVYFNYNQTYRGTYQCHGGGSGTQGEPGGPGTVFLYNTVETHRTLYVNNNKLKTKNPVNLIPDYSDISEDMFKAWILPDSSSKYANVDGSGFSFEELQIYGNSHLAILHHRQDSIARLFFLNMIGDHTGFIHVGDHQSMDLERHFLDTPFSSYVYQGGYLGLARHTNLNRVFARIEGTVDHIHNLTLINGGSLWLFQTGSTNRRERLNYAFNGEVVIKANSIINCSSPNAHTDEYNLQFGEVIIEGGGKIVGSHIKITAEHFAVDDGGQLEVSHGGHLPGQGKGKELFYFYLTHSFMNIHARLHQL